MNRISGDAAEESQMTMKLDTVMAPRNASNLVVVAGLDSKTDTVFFFAGDTILFESIGSKYILFCKRILLCEGPEVLSVE